MFKTFVQSRTMVAALIVIAAGLLFAVLLPIVSPFPGWAAGLLGLALGFMAGMLAMLGHGTSRDALLSVLTGIGAARRGERPARPSEPSQEVSELLAALDSVATDVQARTKRLREAEAKREDLAAQIEERDRRLVQGLRGLDGLAGEWTTALREEIQVLDRLDALAEPTNGADAGGRRTQLVSDTERGADAMRRAVDEIRAFEASASRAREAFTSLRARAEAMGSAIEDAEHATSQAGLVAVNVAILAAQAGESGRAFGVASDEIKELVDRAAGATRTLEQLVEALATDAADALDAVARDASTIDRLARVSSESAHTLRELGELYRAQPRRAETSRDTTAQVEIVRELVRAHERRVAVLSQAFERLRAPHDENTEPERT